MKSATGPARTDCHYSRRPLPEDFKIDFKQRFAQDFFKMRVRAGLELFR